MTPYILLILIALSLSFSTKTLNVNRTKRIFSVTFFFLLLYLLFVLRDINIGRDLPGYSDTYDDARYYNWFDSSWTYMEAGYVFLMKLCSSFGLSFKWFMSICYILVVIPLGKYVCKYSKDISLSLIIYLCFQFFVFNMSGLRQSMAMSLCLMALMVGQQKGIVSFIKYLLLVLCATLIHRSALVFVPAYFLMRVTINFKLGLLYLFLGIIASSVKMTLLQFLQDNEVTRYEFNEALTNGASFIMLLLILIVSMFLSKSSNFKNDTGNLQTSDTIKLTLGNYANLLAISLLLLVTFSGTILMRSASYYNIVLIILVPELLNRFNSSVKPIAKIAFMTLMIGIFYFTVLVPNQFDIVPYRFDF